jgi:hypothetical protein
MANSKALEKPEWMKKIKRTFLPGEDKPIGTGACTNPQQQLKSKRKKENG